MLTTHYRKRNQRKQPKPLPNRYAIPTYNQNYQLKVLLKVVEEYRNRSKEKLTRKLTEMGYTVRDMRIYKSGGVGTFRWMPKYSKYRLQIGATHISNRGFYMPYALCVMF